MDSHVLFESLHFYVQSLKWKANINISRGQKPLIEINLFCLPVSGMMHSQIAGLMVRPAVDPTTMKERRPEMTADLHVNTHLNANLEQH